MKARSLAPRFGAEGYRYWTRLFDPFPDERSDALFAAHRANAWRRLDGESIILDLDKTC